MIVSFFNAVPDDMPGSCRDQRDRKTDPRRGLDQRGVGLPRDTDRQEDEIRVDQTSHATQLPEEWVTDPFDLCGSEETDRKSGGASINTW